MSDLRACVAKGAALLDEHQGTDWATHIVKHPDWPSFSIADPEWCVIGLIFGGYVEGLSRLDIGWLYAWECGFGGDPETFSELTEIWREEINRRNLV